MKSIRFDVGSSLATAEVRRLDRRKLAALLICLSLILALILAADAHAHGLLLAARHAGLALLGTWLFMWKPMNDRLQTRYPPQRARLGLIGVSLGVAGYAVCLALGPESPAFIPCFALVVLPAFVMLAVFVAANRISRGVE